MNPPARRRLLLVGWEAADWKILHPLLDAGEMPAFNRLVEGGASGSLLPVQPAVLAMQWISLATGKRGWQHGVCHSREIAVDTGAAVPITARARRCATLWEILAKSNRRSLIVGWPATHSDQTCQAKIVSDRYPEPTAPAGVKPWPPAAPGTYWPPEIGPVFDKLRVNPAEVAADIIARYVPQWARVDQKRDRRLGQLRVLLASDFSCQTAIAELMKGEEWDFAAVRFSALGPISQVFAPFCRPRQDGIDEDEFELYRDVVRGHYRMLDLMLGELVRVAGKETAVMVVSAQGTPAGIFAAGGTHFAPDVLLHGASVLDVAPTVLTWFGIPIGDDMEGRVLVESFSSPPTIERVPCWEARLGFQRQTDAKEDSVQGKILRRETDWNFAQSCIEAGRYAAASPVLTQLFRTFPERAENGLALFQCQLAMGDLSPAEETLGVVLETLPAGAISLLPQAEIAWARRDFRRARALAEQVRQAQPTHPELLRRLGFLLLRLREWDALAELTQRVLSLDENDPIAWLGLAEARLRKGLAPQAAEAARRAIGLKYFLPEAHFVLARALVAQGLWPEARDAMETLIKLQPGHRTAPAYLKRMRL